MQDEVCVSCLNLKALAIPSLQVCVPQLQVDGGGKRGLPRAPAGLHPPGLSGLRRHVDEAGGQL